MSEFHSDLEQKVTRLYKLSIYSRWFAIAISWMTLGVYALWNLKEEIAVSWDYFTWASVYYGLHFNFLPTLCLAFCFGLTTSVLVWQSRNSIWGLPAIEKKRLEKKVEKILAQGNSHPLWKWIHS